LLSIADHDRSYIRAVNEEELEAGEKTIAIVGATLIDGHGAAPIENSVVLVRGNKIESVGKNGEIEIPSDAEVIEAQGQTLMPGLIDAHYHLNRNDERLPFFLRQGITTVRDPGAWIEDYDRIRASGQPIPRLYLTGPHLDMFPPAYPENSFILQDREETRIAVSRFIEQGASAIKVYFRLSLGLIEEVCATAHSYGVPVTAHLEITHAGDAIRAGLDGIEHITSFGTALLPAPAAEAYRQRVLADNNARRRGRYEVWQALKLENNPRVDSLLNTVLERETYICPTLGAFEKRSDRGDSLEVEAFAKMMAFTGLAHERGARISVGSHSWVPYAPDGWAYAHEMALLAECGLSNAEIIEAATMENARFFRIEDQLGSIEAGKLADLILLDENPLEDIRAMERIRRVMLNGRWVESEN
jgi:imidazolonepropionase-like amidohydrolase